MRLDAISCGPDCYLGEPIFQIWKKKERKGRETERERERYKDIKRKIQAERQRKRQRDRKRNRKRDRDRKKEREREYPFPRFWCPLIINYNLIYSNKLYFFFEVRCHQLWTRLLLGGVHVRRFNLQRIFRTNFNFQKYDLHDQKQDSGHLSLLWIPHL